MVDLVDDEEKPKDELIDKDKKGDFSDLIDDVQIHGLHIDSSMDQPQENLSNLNPVPDLIQSEPELESLP